MPNKKISQLTALAGSPSTSTIFPGVDPNGTQNTEKITLQQILDVILSATNLTIDTTPITGGTIGYLLKINADNTLGAVSSGAIVADIEIGVTDVVASTVGSLLFVGASNKFQEDNANLNYSPGAYFYVNTPSFTAVNDTMPELSIINDEVGYLASPFAGVKFLDTDYSVYSGVYHSTTPYIIESIINLISNRYSTITQEPAVHQHVLGAAGGTNYIAIIADAITPFISHTVIDGSDTSTFDHYGNEILAVSKSFKITNYGAVTGLSILNDDNDYSFNAFAGSKYLDADWDTRMGVIYNGVSSLITLESTDLTTGAGTTITVDSLNIQTNAQNGGGNYIQSTTDASTGTYIHVAAATANTITNDMHAGYINPLYRVLIDNSVTITSFILDEANATISNDAHTCFLTVQNISSYGSLPFAGALAAAGVLEAYAGVYELTGNFTTLLASRNITTGGGTGIEINETTLNISAVDGVTNTMSSFWSIGGTPTILTQVDDGTDSTNINQNSKRFTVKGRFETKKGTNTAAANDLTLPNDGNAFTITGNTTINAILVLNWQAGSEITLLFTGTPTVKHNTAGGAGTAKLFLAGSVDLVAANNTMLGLYYDGTQWQETFRKVA